MAIFTPIEYEDGSNSFTEFLKELIEKHKGEEEIYIAPLLKVVENFRRYGPEMNKYSSKKFPPYKKLDDILKDLAELRTYQCRFFIYKVDKFEWIGLHGYEKQSDDMPKSEKNRAKREATLCKMQRQKR